MPPNPGSDEAEFTARVAGRSPQGGIENGKIRIPITNLARFSPQMNDTDAESGALYSGDQVGGNVLSSVRRDVVEDRGFATIDVYRFNGPHGAAPEGQGTGGAVNG